MANYPISIAHRSRLSSSALYGDLGWGCIPVDADTKRPLIFWKEFAQRRASNDEIARWSRIYPKAGIAVTTGPVSGLVVLDADGPVGVMEARQNGLPRTPMVQTPNGGLHAYFRCPDFAFTNAAKLGKSRKLDVRGEAGYVLAPHSKRSDGKRYSWLIHPDAAAVADAPDWFVKMLRGLGPKPPSRAPLSDIVTDDDLDELLQRLPERVQKLVVDGCDSSFPSRSECDYYVLVQLVAAGIPDDAITDIYETYTIGEKYREPGAGSRYLGRTLERAHDQIREVSIKYADLQSYERGRRLHVALIVENAPDSGRMIRCGLTVPDSEQGSLSVRWGHFFQAAGMPVPIGTSIEARVKQLLGKKMRIQLDESRENPVAAFHRC